MLFLVNLDVHKLTLITSLLQLTAERIERLESIGFIWSVSGPKVSWEDRFNDCVQYYQKNKKWPSQQSGSLGEWVHKQRTKYAKGDKKYMETHAVKVSA